MKQHLLVIGCGSMGSAIAVGLKARHPDWQFTCWTPSGARAQALAQKIGGAHLTDLKLLPADITAVVLGLKPQMLTEASVPLKTLLPVNTPYISLLAAISLSELQQVFPGRPLLRLMPNMAVERNKGVVLWEQVGLDKNSEASWEKALQSLGLAPHISEKLIDVYTLHGASSPAFLFQWLKDAGEFAQEQGGDPQEAVDIFAQAMRGTLDAPLKFSELDARIKGVASKGGVTQAVLDVWQQKYAHYIKQGFAAGLERIQQLKKN
mgnify:CR=1 FL=1